MSSIPHLIPYPSSVVLTGGEFAWPQGSGILPAHLVGLLSVQLEGRWTLDPAHQIVFRLDVDVADEGYVLEVSPGEIEIRASGRTGFLYGCQTLIQLAAGGSVPCCRIEDLPRFKWRGMMLDPSRHFVPKAFVLKFIDLLLLHKMNSLHLHLCDDQGWRIEIKKYPRLTEVGAWRSATPWRPGSDENDGTPHGGFYTQDDLREIVAYAAERGINVVPEIEMPGHSQAALAAYPEFGNTGAELETGIRFGVIEDVYGVQDETIQFLEDVLTEVLEIFPSRFIHVGGDEVPKKQWKESAVAQKRMTDEGLANEDELQSWFIRHFDRWLSDRGRRLVGWDEILEGGVAPGATVMSWRGFEGGIAAAKMGHDVVMAPTGHCYFDHYQSQIKRTEPTAIGGFLPLAKVYAFEPVPPELSEEEAKHVLGGQGQLWSEYLRTTEQVEYMALPRLCALSEVLWGKPAGQDFADFEVRLGSHLELLKRKNYRFRALQPALPDGYHKVGSWAVGEVGASPSVLSFVVPTELRTELEFTVAVHYSGGAYGVWIDAVEVVRESGAERVEREGSTGNFDDGNDYRFAAGAAPREIRVTIRSKGTGELERNNAGDVYFVADSTPGVTSSVD